MATRETFILSQLKSTTNDTLQNKNCIVKNICRRTHQGNYSHLKEDFKINSVTKVSRNSNKIAKRSFLNSSDYVKKSYSSKFLFIWILWIPQTLPWDLFDQIIDFLLRLLKLKIQNLAIFRTWIGCKQHCLSNCIGADGFRQYF